MSESMSPVENTTSSQETQFPEIKVISLSNRNFFKWFTLINGGIVVTTVLWLGPLSLLFPIIGTGGALFSLVFARSLAVWAHQIEIVNPANFRSDQERSLHQSVTDLAARARLPITPAVGIYMSPDLNAFATGPSQKKSMVAFSSTLLDALPEAELRAVIAHEIAHIACRDMLAMVLLQSLVNTIVLAATIPITFFDRLTNNGKSFIWSLGVQILRGTLAFLLTFVGSIGVKAFSRRREYRADAFAARLVGAEPMISALRQVGLDNSPIPRRQLAYATLKISGRPALFEWFSDHPKVEKRIAALEILRGQR